MNQKCTSFKISNSNGIIYSWIVISFKGTRQKIRMIAHNNSTKWRDLKLSVRLHAFRYITGNGIFCYKQIICISRHLKCHWDQNFGIPCFYIFEHSLWFLVTMPNFNLLRRLEVAFFGRFLSRFCGRHYWALFRKLACEWAEVTSEAHLKPGAFTWLLPTG